MKSSVFPLFALAAVLAVGSSALTAGPLGGGASRPERTRARSTGSDGTTPTRPQPTGQNMSEQQKANLQKLQTNLTSIKAGSTVTTEQKEAVKSSLAAIADGATKPSEESVTALTDSLTAALSDQSVSPQEKAQITKSVEAVLQSANIPQSEVQALINSTSALLTASGVTKEEATTVANDLRAVATELKANASAAAAAH